MRIVVVSDTHGQHEGLGVLEGDVLIHCGDFERAFVREDDILDRVDAWFARQRFDLILCTGGNHDFALQACVEAGRDPFRHATLLQDNSVTYRGLSFHGSPWVPELSNFAYYADDADLRTAWAKIPQATDVLITHTPPAGVLDVSSRGLRLGCPHLAQRLQDLRPRLHCFGHVHASAGQRTEGPLTYVNASAVDSNFNLANAPHVFDLEPVAANHGE